jgi:hypothetical protein
MPNLIDEYFAVLEEDGLEFDNPRLEAIQLRMSGQELDALMARLRAEGEAQLKEADELERFGRAKWGDPTVQ